MTRSANFWELVNCAWHGHVLIGTDAREVTAADAPFVRVRDGSRWYRCLRCDDWVVGTPPGEPTRPHVPRRDEIELPLRGPLLRDRFVLRLIALDRAVHVVVLVAVAITLFFFAGHRHAVESTYDKVMNDVLGASGGPSALRGLLGRIHRLFLYSPSHLYELGVVASLYAALELAEMVGLWLARRWAEYLTFIATSLLLPLEIYELTTRLTTWKVVLFVLNLAVAIYLLLAKRLFGARGGQGAEQQRRAEASGWAAFDARTPPDEAPRRRAAGEPPARYGPTGAEQVAEPGAEQDEMTDLSNHELPKEPDPGEIAERIGVDPGRERAGEGRAAGAPVREEEDRSRPPGSGIETTGSP